jgi:hypothetical protein
LQVDTGQTGTFHVNSAIKQAPKQQPVADIRQDPLTPSDCDLRDFPWMPLAVVRLRDSDEVVLLSAEAFRAAILLWCASWHQIPAASLPNDDRILAKLAGYGRDVDSWAKVRDDALHGFIECSDGRLYHPVVAEKAIEAFGQRKRRKAQTQKASEARRGGKRSLEPDYNRNVERNDNRDDDNPSNRHDSRNEVQKRRQDKRRQDKDREREKDNFNTSTESLERESRALEQKPSAVPPDSLCEGSSKVLKKVSSPRLKALGHPLPKTWTPDPKLCEDIKREFGMTDEDIRSELLSFHSEHAAKGTFSANWRASFMTWGKRWKEYRDTQAAPRVELSKAPAKPFVPTDADWDKAASFYARGGHWFRDHGPDPTSPACQCPEAILEKYGINPDTGERPLPPRKVPA